MGDTQKAIWEETTLNTDCAVAATADLLLAASTTTVVAIATTARPQRSHMAATVACTAAVPDSANHATAAMLSSITTLTRTHSCHASLASAAFSALLLNLRRRSSPGRTLRLVASEAGLAEMPQARRPPPPSHPLPHLLMLPLVKLKGFNKFNWDENVLFEVFPHLFEKLIFCSAFLTPRILLSI